jgi:dienelactone hydrolase
MVLCTRELFKRLPNWILAMLSRPLGPAFSIARTLVLALLSVASVTAEASAGPKAEDIALYSTADGVEFGLWGPSASKPAPTLIVLSGAIADSLTKPSFLHAGELLAREGYLCVSIDLPCHGKFERPDSKGLTGWAKRAAAGDDFVAEFNRRLSSVVDHLIAQGLTDPNKIVVTGTSRGGHLAVRYAAHDKRMKCVVAYAPVADLRELSEFRLMKNSVAPELVSLEAHVAPLIGRPVFVVIGDRDDRVNTDSVIQFARRLSAAARAADVPSNVALHVLSEPRGHSVPHGTDRAAAQWIYKTLEGRELPVRQLLFIKALFS